jgi:hypothetical protein
MLKFITNAILGTPVWVWAIFAYLLFTGIKATKSRTVHPSKLFIKPVVLMLLKYKIFMSLTAGLVYGAGYLLAIVIALIIFNKDQIIIDQQNKQIIVPGNYTDLIILLLFFSVKYVFGYLAAVQPVQYNSILLWEVLVSSLLTGYFFGRTLNYLYRYRQAKPQAS